MVNHLIYSGRGNYSPRVCPKVILWQRLPDDEPPDIAVYVPSIDNAQKFADVTVVKDNAVVMSLLRQEEE